MLDLAALDKFDFDDALVSLRLPLILFCSFVFNRGRIESLHRLMRRNPILRARFIFVDQGGFGEDHSAVAVVECLRIRNLAQVSLRRNGVP